MKRYFRIGFEDKMGDKGETFPFAARNRLHALVLFWERQIELVNGSIAHGIWPCRKITSIKEIAK